MINLPDKDPEEILDYAVSFRELLAPGLNLDTLSVEIESPVESPQSLFVESPSVEISGSPASADTVVFWLSGGVVGTRYVIKIEASDSQNDPEDRTFVRRCRIKIKPQ